SEFPRGPVDDGRLPLRRVTPTDLILIADPGFVTPIYKSLLPLRAAGDLRIFLLKPMLDPRIRALSGPRQRFLRRESPFQQVELYGGQPQVFAQAAVDQFPNHARGP